ncbi:uncharacterized protein LOC132302830 isoform X2 [Cornus florida]|uniref:uncharacterized protein LOC132302830 isoform X2 n=1 Tax=Cornus florida TaxID=4283 RepID=UPI00289F70BF|nr:uncharacterized protein LOC132302830 isoform X2 [Cornus florida]
MDRIRQEKVQRFEEFVDRRLKPDLVKAIAQRDKIFEQQKTFSDLRRNIENMEKNSVTSLRTMVNLGSEVYMQAEVPDTRHIFVDIGLGFHVEFTWSEALNYITAREERFWKEYGNCSNFQQLENGSCTGNRSFLQNLLFKCMLQSSVLLYLHPNFEKREESKSQRLGLLWMYKFSVLERKALQTEVHGVSLLFSAAQVK